MVETGGRINVFIKKFDSIFESLNQKIDPYRFLSGNIVKIIAVVIMFIDHFNKIIIAWIQGNIWLPMYLDKQMSWEQFSRIDWFLRSDLYRFGTIAFPLFCFLLVEGFCHTKHFKRYFLLMGVFALVSEIPFDLAFFSDISLSQGMFPFYWRYQNVFFTLFLGLGALWCIKKFQDQTDSSRNSIKLIFFQMVSIVVMTSIAYLIHSDYEAYGVLLIVAIYLFRKNPLYQIFAFLLVYILMTGSQPTLTTFIPCLIILFYNGERGRLCLKYFFYLFYPLHIAILYLVTLLLTPYE